MSYKGSNPLPMFEKPPPPPNPPRVLNALTHVEIIVNDSGMPRRILLDGTEVRNVTGANVKIEAGGLLQLTIEINAAAIETRRE